jgi:hypothetical protein
MAKAALGASTLGSARSLFGQEPPLCLVVPGLLSPEECAHMADLVLAARDSWNNDFGGAQFSLGRAFYTHLETGKSNDYFVSAAGSDATVERVLPGMQAFMRKVCGDLVGGHAKARRGWCGAGVHVFPAGGEVARKGGVLHFDVEGLNERQTETERPALSIVLMLQAPEKGGGLRLWKARYHGREHATRADARTRSQMLDYEVGAVVAFDSCRLHQIQPFSGARDRISITLHAAEVDSGLWETWF